ncbi:MAG: histidine phosphatase family protein [Pseudomonadota bacterium]
MTGTVLRYLSHPQVRVDPGVPVPDWGLNKVGAARVFALVTQLTDSLLAQTTSVFTSPERKARDTAAPIATALECACTVINDSYENDRSATGFLPGAAFEAMADAFFAEPDRSVRGWERAVDAQARIVAAIARINAEAPPGDVLVVGHGAVGTLLFCAQSGQPISRSFDQGPGGGGNIISYARAGLTPTNGWQPMETLVRVDSSLS